MNQEELFNRVIENALDFLAHAIDEFQDRPKHSIIHFYTAVELFLKARLLSEHWSLIVLRDPDFQKLKNGDFVSASFDGICERLEKVAQSAVPQNARRNFDVIRKHRNKMVHFFHGIEQDVGPEKEIIAREQLRAWHDLNQLLTIQWSPIFADYNARFNEIEERLRRHREYLQAKFDGIAAKIEADKKNGAEYRICNACKFPAALVASILGDLQESTCLVCGNPHRWINFECPNCEQVSDLTEGGEFICDHCGQVIGETELIKRLNDFEITKDNYFDAVVPANCSECDGYHTVVEYKDQYLCIMCFALTEDLEQCGWCGEYNNGDMTESAYAGCTECDGSAGWHADKD